MKRLHKHLTILLVSSALSGCVADYPGNYPPEWGDENAYWQGAYVNEPYYSAEYGYDAYQPAYLYGVNSYHRYNGRRFEDINDAELRANWEHSHGNSHLDWEHARPAVHAAYAHVASRSGGSYHGATGGEHGGGEGRH